MPTPYVPGGVVDVTWVLNVGEPVSAVALVSPFTNPVADQVSAGTGAPYSMVLLSAWMVRGAWYAQLLAFTVLAALNSQFPGWLAEITTKAPVPVTVRVLPLRVPGPLTCVNFTGSPELAVA